MKKIPKAIGWSLSIAVLFVLCSAFPADCWRGMGGQPKPECKFSDRSSTIILHTVNLAMPLKNMIPLGDMGELEAFHQGFGLFKPISDLSQLINAGEYSHFSNTPQKRSSISIVLTSSECTKDLKKNLVEPFVDVASNALIIDDPEHWMSTIKYEVKTILTSGGWRLTWAATKDFNSSQDIDAVGTTVNQQVFQLNTGIEIPGLENRYVINPDGSVSIVFDQAPGGGGGVIDPGGGGIMRSGPAIYMGGEYNDGYTLDF